MLDHFAEVTDAIKAIDDSSRQVWFEDQQEEVFPLVHLAK